MREGYILLIIDIKSLNVLIGLFMNKNLIDIMLSAVVPMFAKVKLQINHLFITNVYMRNINWIVLLKNLLPTFFDPIYYQNIFHRQRYYHITMIFVRLKISIFVRVFISYTFNVFFLNNATFPMILDNSFVIF